MTTAQIVLLILGLVIVIISFFVVDRNEEHSSDIPLRNLHSNEITEDDIRGMKSQIQSISEEEIAKSLELTKDELSKLSNETIMSVHEYSDQVLAKIDHNNEEVVFLYNMLTTKEEELKQLFTKIDSARRESKEYLERLEELKNNGVMNEVSKKVDQIDINEKNNNSLDMKELWTEFDIEDDDVSLDETIQNRNEAILKLHRQKKSVLEISRQLGIGQGEVKLVIGLYGDNLI
ncbi:DUF6115 domain-containing protein [Clostridium sp. Marseille-P299]|uniref:DUF6115 domain-containing protein n=1 Tax=Clostridium sp. Marseille-P299 TaxID=1805477 RepID=UPI000836453E|nr:DUF6115 domain-containing protein [Clostridium sp. Marseille-P299]